MAIFKKKMSASFQASESDNFSIVKIGRDFINCSLVFCIHMAGNVSQIWLSAAHLQYGF